jgi:hypothetical protein
MQPDSMPDTRNMEITSVMAFLISILLLGRCFISVNYSLEHNQCQNHGDAAKVLISRVLSISRNDLAPLQTPNPLKSAVYGVPATISNGQTAPEFPIPDSRFTIPASSLLRSAQTPPISTPALPLKRGRALLMLIIVLDLHRNGPSAGLPSPLKTLPF